MNQAHAREALRQQMLLRALLGDARPAVVAGWLHESSLGGPRFQRGLAAYRANAGALADRALAAAFPTVQQLMGEESFGLLARHFWQCHPPSAGDMALWGGDLPSFIAEVPALAGEPYLADVASVDWAVHLAGRAADTTAAQGLELLAALDPAQLRLQLAAGTAVIVSSHPVVAIWQAHRADAGTGDERFAPVRSAFADGRGETALVVRQGWAAQVLAIAQDEAAFTQALLAGQSLAAALACAGDAFEFEPWLITALQQRRLLAVTALARVSAIEETT